MIKLNNKNITYVALADSNNSLKAPKEIWYADSNNSVKLVYRRKDALIEGEDYEKYHWLEGDGNSYLDVKGFSRNENWEIVTKLRQRNINTWVFLYGVGMIGNSYDDGVWTAFGGTVADRVAVRVSNGTTHKDYFLHDITENQEIQVIDKHSSVVFNGNVISVTYPPNRIYKQCNEFYIFSQYYTNRDTPLRIADADFSDFIVNESGINILNLIPCKLLKPVPKWLDANGIRRQVGECGMIDLVSGKFYGNVSSVGTFTVENYYERKEWLVADIPANTRCIDLPINSNVMSYSMLISQVGNSTFFETVGNYRYYTTPVNLPSIAVWNIATSSNVNSFRVGLQENELFNITSSESSLIINGVDVQKIGFPVSAVVFRCGGSYGNRITDTSSIFVDGEERYIPCILTMDLPASMDANNIARTKGTSGMWDLVSDRFYGNVANSGTFKAVNLAEGVDYEVHQWLKVELVGTNASMMILPVNSYSFAFSRKPLKGKNVPYFLTKGNDVYLYSTTNDTIRIWNQTQYGYYYSGTSFNWGDTISIVSSGNGLEVNSQVIPQNTFPCKYVYFGANDVDGTENYTSSINVDGIERYIPVKLLKSIPSKYDANGIARQAGECGMYDTVNDLFYGNVASSGSFTVEDDS